MVADLVCGRHAIIGHIYTYLKSLAHSLLNFSAELMVGRSLHEHQDHLVICWVPGHISRHAKILPMETLAIRGKGSDCILLQGC